MKPLIHHPSATWGARPVHWRCTIVKGACPRSPITAAGKGVGNPPAFAAVPGKRLCLSARRNRGAGGNRCRCRPAGGSTVHSELRNKLIELQKRPRAETRLPVCVRASTGRKRPPCRDAGEYRWPTKRAGEYRPDPGAPNRLIGHTKTCGPKQAIRSGCGRKQAPEMPLQDGSGGAGGYGQRVSH